MRLVFSLAFLFALLTFVSSSALIKRGTECRKFEGGATWSTTSYPVSDVTSKPGYTTKYTRFWHEDITLFRVGGDKLAFKQDIADSYSIGMFIQGNGMLSIGTAPSQSGARPKYRQFLYEIDAGKKGIHKYWSGLKEADQCWLPVGFSRKDVNTVTVRYRE